MATKRPVVAFLGPRATYTHQATAQRFLESEFDFMPLVGIEDVFKAVQAGNASYGVVPFENSTNGSVIFTLDLFADIPHRFPDILVCGEIYIPIHHCLLGYAPEDRHSRKADAVPNNMKDEADSPVVSGECTPTPGAPQPTKPRVKPLHDLSNVVKLYSHPQAWGQCKLFLSAYLKHAEKQDVSSTARAAEIAAQDTTGTSAAVSSKIAADSNGLDVLAENIEDTGGNSTRFFILQRQQDAHPEHEQPFVDDSAHVPRYKSLVSFQVNHGEPGALADSLAVFKKHKLNLTSINTRPSGQAEWHYIFFVEFMGKKHADGTRTAVDDALNELNGVALHARWLGSWEDELKS